jgi:nitrile hydratase subunit beta
MPTSSDPVAVDAIRKIGPHVHERASSTAFAVGQEIRVRRMRPEGHHRCPRYVRGAVGEIEKVVGADPVPGLQADQRVTEPCYTVRFSSTDLFGDEATDGEPPYQLLIDLWERYLEPVT